MSRPMWTFARSALASLPVAILVVLTAPTPAFAASETLPGLGLAGDPGAGGGPMVQGYGYRPPRFGGYQPPTGPTRDQTSPFGIEVQVGAMARRVKERLPTGEEFRFDVDSTRALVKLTLRPARFFEVYGLGGGADLNSGFEDADFDGDFDFAYGGGAKLTFFRNPDWYDTAVFAEGRFLQFESEADSVPFQVPAAPPGTVVFVNEKFRWREWEGRMGVSWRFYLARPYLGVRYSDAEADDIVDPGGPLDTRLGRLRATRHVGGFIGADLYFDPSRQVGLTAEITFPDQVSGFAGLRVWF